MPIFVKKPLPIEAVRFTGENWAEVHAFTGHHMTSDERMTDTFRETDRRDVDAVVWDVLHSTWVGVLIGQWIMKGTKGEFYPCEDDGTGTAPMNYEEVQDA